MSPSAKVTQCACCMGNRRVKKDGTFYQHDRGRLGRQTHCPGSHKTPEEAKRVHDVEKSGGTLDPLTHPAAGVVSHNTDPEVF